MTAKRFMVDDAGTLIDVQTRDMFDIVEEVVDLLNELYEENEDLKQELISLRVELDTHKHPLWSTREAERKVSELIELLADEVKKNGELLKENNLLRIENKRLLKHKKDF